jgi:hypothetical protein
MKVIYVIVGIENLVFYFLEIFLYLLKIVSMIQLGM